MKLFTVLHKLPKRKLSRFKQFINSPLYNRREDVQLLLDGWIQNRKMPQPKEVYWQQLFPQKDFSRTQFNLLVSRLYKLLEEFLALDYMRENEAKKKFYLAKGYRQLQLETQFKSAIQDAESAIEKQAYQNADYLQFRHDLTYARYEYLMSSNRKEKTNLQEVSNQLDAYFLAAKLRQACNALSRQIINQEEYEIGLLSPVLAKIESSSAYLEVPAIAVYYYCYQVIEGRNNETYFGLLRDAIARYQQYFPPYEMRDMYTFVINFYIRKLNSGSSVFAREAFELYRLSLREGYLLEDGILLESTYVNIVVLAAVLGEYAWANRFLKDYQSLLKPAYQVPLFHYGKGKLYYEQAYLDDSLSHLLQVETKASFLFLAARILQLKIYYELEEIDLLDSLMESIRVYLHRSKDLAYRKIHYNNILVFMRQLQQLPLMNKKDREAFRQRILAEEIFGEKEWFLKQIDN